ncbi:helix-turn-helix domain-containing protein [Thermodesulfitimonas autotrophica]|uniref:helix-turn-helix domain-containing protein n=1 Tax=Thermodesulfitimonas autotrophica TaxID=1894989 RepID=UPI000F500A45
MLTLKEAAEEWGVADATIRQYILKRKFRANEVRKSGGTWLVKRSAMRRVFGSPRKQ